MLKKTSHFFLFVSLLALFAYFASNAKAQSFVEQKFDCQYIIKVDMVFNFKDQAAKEQADFLLAKWQKGMADVWNGDYGSKIFSQGTVEFEFNLKKMNLGESCLDYPNAHCISVVSEQFNQRGYVADAVIVEANSLKNSWGEWTIRTSGLNAAHEAGHLMGLEDEYYYEENKDSKKWVNGNWKKIGPQSIMAQTWGNVAAFSEHTEQIMSKAGFVFPVCSPGAVLPQQDKNVENFDFSLADKTDFLEPLKFYLTPNNLKIYTARPLPSQLKGAIIKGETDPAVYFVDDQGKLRWLVNEDVARKIAGDDWAVKIIWFSDAIIYTYQFGEMIKNEDVYS